EAGRGVARLPGATLRWDRRVRGRGVRSRQQLGARDAVDRGMVDLEEDREAASRYPLDVVDTLDHRHLPQGATAIEHARVKSCGLRAQLLPVPRTWQRDVLHVVFEGEVRIVHPVREVDTEAGRDDLLAERAGEMQSAVQVGEHPGEA